MASARKFDDQISADAKKVSDDYAGVVALSVRQSLGANEITISKNKFGGWNTSDVLVFMKGNSMMSPLRTNKMLTLLS